MIEIDFPIAAITGVFESNCLPKGKTREVPGGAMVELRTVPMPEQPPQLAYDHEPIFTVAVHFGHDVAVSVFASWLYDRLKTVKVRRIKINRRTVEVTPEGILRTIEESIEVEDKRNKGVAEYALLLFNNGTVKVMPSSVLFTLFCLSASLFCQAFHHPATPRGMIDKPVSTTSRAQ